MWAAEECWNSAKPTVTSSHPWHSSETVPRARLCHWGVSPRGHGALCLPTQLDVILAVGSGQRLPQGPRLAESWAQEMRGRWGARAGEAASLTAPTHGALPGLRGEDPGSVYSGCC